MQKKWYQHKKLWLCVIALALVIYQIATGKHGEWTPMDIAHYVVVVSSFLLPLVATILAFAHVDARSAAGQTITEIISTAASLEQPDEDAPKPTPSP